MRKTKEKEMKEKKQESFATLNYQLITAYAKKDKAEIRKAKKKFDSKLRANYRGITAGKNPRVSLNPRIHKIGSKVRGCRKGSASDGKEGIIVDCYSTLNKGFYKNPAYVVKCENGKKRIYQHVIQIEKAL